jgi:putative CocE/NonD family hydrolase
MQEPPIRYYTMGAKTGWHTANRWPLQDQVPTKYYFSGGPTGSVSSVNDGVLSTSAPTDASSIDVYQVDYSTSQGNVTRGSADSKSLYFNNQVPIEEKGLTYTTDPLGVTLEVTGHPILHLWVTSSAGDGDFFVYLTDVTDSGASLYITEGKLRASRRATSTAPYEYLGLPYHRSYEADIADLAGEPVELVFDMLPTSYVFGEGHRIRVYITCANKDNYSTPVFDPAPTVSVYHDAEHASYIELPIIP